MINKNRLCFSQCEQMVGMKLQKKNPSGTPLIRLFSLLHGRILLTNFTNLQVQNQGFDFPKRTELLPLSWGKKIRVKHISSSVSPSNITGQISSDDRCDGVTLKFGDSPTQWTLRCIPVLLLCDVLSPNY